MKSPPSLAVENALFKALKDPNSNVRTRALTSLGIFATREPPSSKTSKQIISKIKRLQNDAMIPLDTRNLINEYLESM